MKKITIFIAVMAIFISGASMAQAGWDAYTTADVNMREGPGNGYRVIVVVPEGELVYVHDCPGRWCDVEWRSYRGYIFGRYLSEAGSGYYEGYVAPPVIVVPEYDGGYSHVPRKRKLRRHRPGQYHERPVRPSRLHRRMEQPGAMHELRERRTIRRSHRHQMQQINPHRHQQRLERRRYQDEGQGSPHLQRKRRKLQD